MLVGGWAMQRLHEQRLSEPHPMPGGRRRGDPATGLSGRLSQIKLYAEAGAIVQR